MIQIKKSIRTNVSCSAGRIKSSATRSEQVNSSTRQLYSAPEPEVSKAKSGPYRESPRVEAGLTLPIDTVSLGYLQC